MKSEKIESQKLRLKVLILWLIYFMKVIFAQYPVLPDLHFLTFLLLCNMRFVLKHTEGLVLIGFVMGFSGLNTVFMWITWLDRFSGNANFFFFQTVIFNISWVILFVQIYTAINAKVKKYSGEIELPKIKSEALRNLVKNASTKKEAAKSEHDSSLSDQMARW